MRVARWASMALVTALSLSSTVAEAQSAVLGGCSSLGSGVRTMGGAVLGAWVGFVGAKMKLSDWNETSHTPAAIRQLNQITIAGAVVGAVVGNLAFRHPCRSYRGAIAEGKPRVSKARRPITEEEIQRSGMTGSVYDLVYLLRRNWLNDRGLQSMSEAARIETDSARHETTTIAGETKLIVYLDNVRLGTISELRELPVAGIIGVVYYDPSEATFKWGTGHAHGAIQVLSVTDPNNTTLRPLPQKLLAPMSLPF